MPPKITIVRKTKAETSAKSTTSTARSTALRNVLTQVTVEGGERLTPEQINILFDLRYPDGRPILTHEQPEAVLSVINALKRLPFMNVVTFLRGVRTPRETILETPLLKNERERVELEIENLRTKIEAERGIYKCEKCGSHETLSTQAQVRSADEPMTTFLRCLSCGKRWTIG